MRDHKTQDFLLQGARSTDMDGQFLAFENPRTRPSWFKLGLNLNSWRTSISY